MKFTVVPLGIRYPPISMSSAALCGSTKWPGGCFRRASRITALRYGILWTCPFLVVVSGGLDLVVELLLDGWVFYELGHDPLQPCRRGVRTGVEELGT
jgi:hypothetical protein